MPEIDPDQPAIRMLDEMGLMRDGDSISVRKRGDLFIVVYFIDGRIKVGSGSTLNQALEDLS